MLRLHAFVSYCKFNLFLLIDMLKMIIVKNDYFLQIVYNIFYLMNYA